MNTLTIVARGLRNQLITNPSLASILLVSGTQYKIHLTAAPAVTEPPYVRIVHLYGGDENHNSSRSFDLMIRVDGVSRDFQEADFIAGLIDASLVGSQPALTNGWSVWHPITQHFVFNDVLLINQEQFFSMGAQYRVRGVL